MNAGIRAFFVSGGKARFDGIDPVTGEKRFKAVTATQDKVLRQSNTVSNTIVKGTNLEFRLSPTVTALLPSTGFETQHTLTAEGLLSTLSTDFAHALKTLSLTLADLKRLSALGSLPISLKHTSKGPILSVRFPGCDATTVTLLCEELGIVSGIIREDAEWDESKEVEMALLFPFVPNGHSADESESSVEEFFERKPAPSQLEWQGMMTPSTDIRTPSSTVSYDHVGYPLRQDDAAASSPSGYESMHASDDFGPEDPYFGSYGSQAVTSGRTRGGTDDVQELEGIYHFLRECEDARRR